jgi:hypothetical protein
MLLNALSNAPSHALTLYAARRVVGAASFDGVLGGLQRDGLVHRSGGRLRLGGSPEATATIEP